MDPSGAVVCGVAVLLQVLMGRSATHPTSFVNQLRLLNGGRKYMPGASGEPMAQAPTAPAQKPAAAAAAREPARVPALQAVEANPRT